jgi:hypothetical protein
MLAELADELREGGATVFEIAAAPSPRSEVGFSFVRALVAKLGGEPWAREARGDAIDALERAVDGAIGNARGALVVVAMDDVDRTDGVSRAIIDEAFSYRRAPALVVIATQSTQPPSRDGVRDMPLTGLSRTDAQRLVSRTSVPPPQASRASDRLVEPLYMEQFLRWRAEHRKEKRDIPTTLAALVEDRIAALEPSARRTLQAVSVVGGGGVADIAALVGRDDDVTSALSSLADAGFLRRDGDVFGLAHRIFGAVALRDAPAGAVEQLHARAADALEQDANALELRAWHAIRGRVDFEAFALVEESARRRAACGDAAGAVAALSDGYVAARTCVARLDERAASAAWIVFGRKLADQLVRNRQLVEARGILAELLQTTGPLHPARAPILETLARIAEESGRDDEAERLRREIGDSTPAPARPIDTGRFSIIEERTSPRFKKPKDVG